MSIERGAGVFGSGAYFEKGANVQLIERFERRYVYILSVISLYQMIHNYTRYKILEVFFDYPCRNFHLRELVRISKISMPSMLVHIHELVKDGFIIKQDKGIYPSYCANRDDSKYKLYKVQNLVLRLNSSGFIEFLDNNCLPDSIILFGSSSKGEDSEESDIDLFVQSKERKLGLDKYEKQLKRKINLFFEEDFSKLSAELRNNISNGIKLAGYLKIF